MNYAYTIVNNEIGNLVTFDSNQPLNLDHLAKAFDMGGEHTSRSFAKGVTVFYENGHISTTDKTA